MSFHLPVISFHLLSFVFRLLSFFISFPFFPFIFRRLQYTKKRRVVLFSHMAKWLQIKSDVAGRTSYRFWGGPIALRSFVHFLTKKGPLLLKWSTMIFTVHMSLGTRLKTSPLKQAASAPISTKPENQSLNVRKFKAPTGAKID